jgi:alkanesulfonate monooxygenase SsuD/methylene tetrahydromethanopterin reductase-like flavin-dependent oxidoreductase (luciferase family)
VLLTKSDIAPRRTPVLVGGAPGDAVFGHVAEYGQGWVPVGGHGLARAIPRLREHVARAGRDPGGLQVVPFTTARADHARLDAYERAGGTEVCFGIDAGDGPTVRAVLDRRAALTAGRRG